MTDEASGGVAAQQGGLMAIRSFARVMCRPSFPGWGKKAKALFRHKTAELLDQLYRDLMQQAEVKLFVECGAHEARTSIEFVSRTGGKAIAIEANPSIYLEKTQKAHKYGVTTLNLALADREGELPFHIPADPRIAGSASLLTKASGTHDAVMVQTKTLDQVLRSHGSPDAPFSLWIDVEGMAFPVLMGGTETLANKHCTLIKVELEEVPQWLNQITAREVDALLQSFGFVPVFCDLEYESQFNAVYIRESLVARLLPSIIAAWHALGKIKLSAAERLLPKVAKMDTDLID